MTKRILFTLFIFLLFKPVASQDKGLIAYYPFDNNANDVSGNNNNPSSITGDVLFVKGVIGQSVKFGGYYNSGQIEIPNSSSLQFKKELTICYYTALDDYGGMDGFGNFAIEGAGNCPVAKSHDRNGFVLKNYIKKNGDFYYSFDNNFFNTESFALNGNPIKNYELHSWFHIAYVINNDNAKIFINGKLVSTFNNLNIDFKTANKQKLYIGRFSDSWYPYNGKIDELRIYNYALSDNEIKLIYGNNGNSSEAGESPYPIIFIHGLNSNDIKWLPTINKLKETWETSLNNVMHVVLNARGGDTTACENDVLFLSKDTKGQIVNKLVKSNIFAVNFQNFWNRNSTAPRIITYSNKTPGRKESQSNQSAIYKQGYALKRCIEEVLSVTGAEKVILAGHSMGGLAIREYLQHRNLWSNKNDIINGHKVAKVLTIGTPHLGSNMSKVNIELLTGIDNKSESVRDLRYSYDLLNRIPGAYLFGNSENKIPGRYFNKDVNCNGSVSDYITGLNKNTSFNTQIPLPSNILYTWITSKVSPLNSDGIVDIDRQWLHTENIPQPADVADTLLTNKLHWNETEDYISVIRGLDEPDTPESAYNISLNKTYAGFITTQQNNEPLDIDYFKINIYNTGDLNVSINGSGTGLFDISILSTIGESLINKPINNGTGTITYNAIPGEYFIRITGYGNQNINFNSYRLTVESKENSGEMEGLLSYYSFDNNFSAKGIITENAIKNGNTIIFDDGYKNQGIRFFNNNNKGYYDVNDYLKLPNISVNNFTVAFWIKFEKNKHDYQASVYSFGDDLIGNGPRDFFVFWVLPDGKLRVSMQSGINSVSTSHIDISSGEWIHVAAAISDTKITLFNNGKAVFAENFNFTHNFINLHQYTSFHQWNNGKYFSSRFSGMIDELYIFNKALDDDEIFKLFKN